MQSACPAVGAPPLPILADRGLLGSGHLRDISIASYAMSIPQVDQGFRWNVEVSPKYRLCERYIIAYIESRPLQGGTRPSVSVLAVLVVVL